MLRLFAYLFCHRERDEESFRASECHEIFRDLKREEIAAVLLILFFVLLVLVWIITPMLPTLTGGYP